MTTIRIDTDLTSMVNDAIQALGYLQDVHGAPLLYQRARRLSLIASGVLPPQWLRRPPDIPIIVEANPARLYELLTGAATWEKYSAKNRKWITASPPLRIVPTIQGRSVWPFPVLEGIIHSPTLRPDGSILDTPGYDVATGLYVDWNGTAFPPVPRSPDIFDAQKALMALKDVLQDFMWAHPYDQSAALAALLSLTCRFTVLGNVPLFGITATTRGSGKGLLADVVALIGTGRQAALWPQADDDAEERKRMLALGLDGDACLVIDNVTRPLGSGALDLVLTSGTFKDRVLGTQTSLEVPMNTVFLATGNNMQYLGDLARRVVPIALDPKLEKPEERTGFKYPDLLTHVQQHRPALVVAALTLLKAYFEASCPQQNLSAYGSFQPWSDRIRSALVWAGEPDPCEGRTDIEAQSDPQYEALAALLGAWSHCYPPGTKTTLKALRQDISTRKDTHVPPIPNVWDDLESALCDFDARSLPGKLNPQSLGERLKCIGGRIINRHRLVKAGTYKHALQWQLENI